MYLNTDRAKAMRFEHPEYIPIMMGLSPVLWRKYREELDELVMRHPVIFGPHKRGSTNYDKINTALCPNYEVGEHADPWGYTWTNIQWGCDAYVSHHPLPRREMVWDFKPPPPGAGMPHGCMFLRLIYLRGYEEAMLDFAEEPPELQRLIDIVLEYNVGELEHLLRNSPKMAGLADDLGTQKALPISPKRWRKYLKPCYAKLYGMCHEAGASVFMHTDGHIIPIIKDLIECGVDVLNPQISANVLDRLAEECKGKVCLCPELDGQMLPFATPEEIDAHVLEVVEKLGSPEGGLWFFVDCGPDVPLENIEAICQAFEKYRGFFR